MVFSSYKRRFGVEIGIDLAGIAAPRCNGVSVSLRRAGLARGFVGENQVAGLIAKAEIEKRCLEIPVPSERECQVALAWIKVENGDGRGDIGVSDLICGLTAVIEDSESVSALNVSTSHSSILGW